MIREPFHARLTTLRLFVGWFCERPPALASRRAVSLAAPILIATLALAACALTPGSRETAYPLRWQAATSLPPHTVSLAFASTAPTVGYACTVAVGSAAVHPVPTATAHPSPRGTPTARPAAPFVYQAADGGAHWSPVAAPTMQGRACRVFVASRDPRDVFVALPSSPEDDTGLLSQLFRSRDGGATWQQLGQISQPGERFSFASVAVVGQRIVAEVGSIGVPRLPEQLYASGDDGKTWQQIAQQYTPVDLYAAGDVLYLNAAQGSSAKTASGSAGDEPRSGNPPPTTLYRSTDGGQTWTQVNVPFSDVTDLHFLLAVDGAHQYGVGLIPATTAYGAVANAVIVTHDGGATWARSDAPPTIGTLSADLLPEGTILAQSLLPATQPAGGPTGEVFRQRSGATASDPTWELLGVGPYVTNWQVARASPSASATTRLWGVTADRSSAERYVYADLP